MNILLLVSSLNFGGAEKQVVEDANLLCRENTVYVLSFNNGPLSKLLKSSVKLILLERKNYISSIFEVASIIRIHGISLVHAHLFAPMVLSSFAGRLTGVPVVWNFHSHAYENSLKGKILHKYAGRLSSVRRILFPTTELKNYYEKKGYGFNNQKCQIAYNSGQNIESLLGNTKEMGDGIIHFGFIGRIIQLKQIHLLIELAELLVEKQICNFIIDIVGDGPELQKLIQSVKKKKLDSFVLFHGFQHDTLSFYRQFDIFIFPSREEVLSLSLIDAGLSGLPSVAFDIGGNYEIITNGITGYLLDSTESFYDRIIELMHNKELRELLGNNARKECNAKFSPEVRLGYLSQLYAELV